MSQGRLGQYWTHAHHWSLLAGQHVCLDFWQPCGFTRDLSHSVHPFRRQWSRQLTTSSSHKPWMPGETWLQVINYVQPPCCLTLWRKVLLCWLITFWRLTSSGRTQTIFVSGLCSTEGPERDKKKLSSCSAEERKENVSSIADQISWVILYFSGDKLSFFYN